MAHCEDQHTTPSALCHADGAMLATLPTVQPLGLGVAGAAAGSGQAGAGAGAGAGEHGERCGGRLGVCRQTVARFVRHVCAQVHAVSPVMIAISRRCTFRDGAAGTAGALCATKAVTQISPHRPQCDVPYCRPHTGAVRAQLGKKVSLCMPGKAQDFCFFGQGGAAGLMLCIMLGPGSRGAEPR